MTPPPPIDWMERARFLRELQAAGVSLAYLHNLFLALDQFANAALGGDPSETVSSRLGKMQRAAHGHIPWSRPVAAAAAALLDALDPSHCRRAIRKDRGARALVDYFGRTNSRKKELAHPGVKCYYGRNKKRKAES